MTSFITTSMVALIPFTILIAIVILLLLSFLLLKRVHDHSHASRLPGLGPPAPVPLRALHDRRGAQEGIDGVRAQMALVPGIRAGELQRALPGRAMNP